MSLKAAWKGRAVMLVSPLVIVRLTIGADDRVVTYKPVIEDLFRLPTFKVIDELLGILE